VVEIYGPESSGKTTVALHAVASAQKAGGIAAFIDAEHALDPEYAKALGVDIDELLVSQPDTGEQALEIADMLIRSGPIDIIVIDSVAALTPRAEIEGEMGDSHVGLQARLMSQALRKLTGALNNSGTCAIFINQLREKIGVMFGCFSYGTRVTLADGTQEKIGKIVNQKLPVEVLSYDPETDEVVPSKVVNWFDNGVADGSCSSPSRSPAATAGAVRRTENHLIRTPGAGARPARSWSATGSCGARPTAQPDQQWQVVLGSSWATGTCRRTAAGTVSGSAWATAPSRSPTSTGRRRCSEHPQSPDHRSPAPPSSTSPPARARELREAVYSGDGKKHLSEEYLKALTPLALAVWYMDDGSSRSGRRACPAAHRRWQRAGSRSASRP
jgi:recombination protein RecA